MKVFRRSIRTKIMALAVVSITLGTLIIGGVSYMAAWNALDHKLKSSDLLNLVKYQAERIDGSIKKAKETALILANDSTLNAWFKGGESNKTLGKLSKEKLTNIKTTTQYATISAVNKSTNNYWANDGELIDTLNQKDNDDGWFFRTLASQEEVSIQIDFNKELNNTFVFINALMGNVTNPNGVAGVGLDLTELSEAFSKEDQFGGKNWLIDQKGVIQIANDISQIGKPIGEIFGETISSKVLDLSLIHISEPTRPY